MQVDEPVGTFALRLSRLMDERGLSQNALARLLGMDRSETVWRWANAQSEPSYVMLRRLRDALDCTYEDLFVG